METDRKKEHTTGSVTRKDNEQPQGPETIVEGNQKTRHEKKDRGNNRDGDAA